VSVSVVVEIGQATTTTWTEITCQVFGLGWARGASEDRGVLAVPESGSCIAFLIDPNRDLDPANVSSALYGLIDVGARFRITLAGVVAFVGRIDTIEHDLDPPPGGWTNPTIPLCRLGVADAISRMAGVDSAPGPFPQESSSRRINRLLDAANVATATGQRDLESGGETIQAAAGLVNDAWSDALAIVQNELGAIDFRPDGTVVYRLRDTTWTPGPPALEVGCQTGALELASLKLMNDRTTIRNRIDAARAGGSALIEEDAPSQAKYGLRATERHDLVLNDDAAVDAWALTVLRRGKVPTRGFTDAVIQQTDAAGVAAIEAVPLFTGRVHLQQDHYGPTIDTTLRLLGVSWDVDADANATATLILGTDTAVTPVPRRYQIDTQAEWTGRATGGATSGAERWELDAGVLRCTAAVTAGSHAPGGLDSIVFTWSSQL